MSDRSMMYITYHNIIFIFTLAVESSLCFPSHNSLTCKPQTIPEHGSIPEYIFNSKYQYKAVKHKCLPGYSLEGHELIRCRGTSWEFPEPTCVKKEQSVTTKTGTMAKEEHSSEDFIWKEIITRNPVKEEQSAEDLRWNASMTGTLVNGSTCKQRTVPKHSKVTVLVSNLDHQYVSMIYECQPGYILKGNNVIHCLGTSWEFPEPTCRSIGISSDNIALIRWLLMSMFFIGCVFSMLFTMVWISCLARRVLKENFEAVLANRDPCLSERKLSRSLSSLSAYETRSFWMSCLTRRVLKEKCEAALSERDPCLSSRKLCASISSLPAYETYGFLVQHLVKTGTCPVSLPGARHL